MGKQNKTTTTKKKKKKTKDDFFLGKSLYLAPFLWNLRRQTQFKADRAVFNYNSKVYFRKITGLFTVKNQCKSMSWQSYERTA